jgi:hypothetical protein
MVHLNVGKKNRKDLAYVLAILLVTAAVSSLILTITLQHANAFVSTEVEKKFIDACSLESNSKPPHLDISHCPDAKGELRNSPGGSTVTDQDLNQGINTNALYIQNPRAFKSTSNSTTEDFGTQEITKFNNEAAALKTTISSATFTPGNGIVKELINKVAFFGGEVSVMGGGTWTILHGVEDALISKIKESGPSSFSADEQSYIAAWVNRVMTDRKEHPDFSSQVLPGFNQSP